jgi:hypothetical protein
MLQRVQFFVPLSIASLILILASLEALDLILRSKYRSEGGLKRPVTEVLEEVPKSISMFCPFQKT